MQRLNDPSSGIRILAASVIPKLQLKLYEEADVKNESKTYDNDIWLAFIKNCFDMLYLHYDNPDERLKITIKGTYNFLDLFPFSFKTVLLCLQTQ